MKPMLAAAAIAGTMFAASCSCPFGSSCTEEKSGAAVRTENVKAPAGMKLVWSDEFNKDGFIDPSNWGFETGFSRNHEAQWYQKESAAVKDGNLVITAERLKPVRTNNYCTPGGDWKTDRGTIEYTSACLTSQHLRSFQYGRIEARIKAPLIEGAWPAFWTCGVTEEWPCNGEIDIFEFYKGKILANFCWSARGNPWSAAWSTERYPLTDFTKDNPDWANQYHVYAMDWDENRIVISVDGKVLNDTPVKDIKNAIYKNLVNPFHQPHYLLLNMALGGDNGGDISGIKFPIQMYVDYVRVFQKK